MIIEQDIHIHTNLSGCAQRNATVEGYIDFERENGIKTMGIADHLWDDTVPIPYQGAEYNANAKTILDFKEKVKKTEFENMKILVGAEAEYDRVNHGLIMSEETAAQLDFLLAPNSHTHITMEKCDRENDVKHAKFMLNAWYDILSCPVAKYITSMAHPFTSGIKESVIKLITDKNFEECFKAAKECNVAIEINSSVIEGNAGGNAIASIIRTEAMRMYTIAKECGCVFTFGTDAHEFKTVGSISSAYVISSALELKKENILLL